MIVGAKRPQIQGASRAIARVVAVKFFGNSPTCEANKDAGRSQITHRLVFKSVKAGPALTRQVDFYRCLWFVCLNSVQTTIDAVGRCVVNAIFGGNDLLNNFVTLGNYVFGGSQLPVTECTGYNLKLWRVFMG